ncbi:hypothetical protein ES703_91006 [subsurface metagenome]
MAVVISALLPVFLLIVLGFVLRRSLMRLDTQWHGLERLTYYVLFPTLLIQTLVKADLSSVPVAGVGGALSLTGAGLLGALLCWSEAQEQVSLFFAATALGAMAAYAAFMAPRLRRRVHVGALTACLAAGLAARRWASACS